MATTLAMAREAEHILSAAAVRAGLPETVLAAELLDASRGVPVPVRAERALREGCSHGPHPGPRTVLVVGPVPAATARGRRESAASSRLACD
ncbi:hypothetical protein ABT224_36915 [Streptomyces sp. NPDC001584]|uniref:hypothetical protein n=1 Tax=Streptomyces sp. NPDC001584 TaxID=3154521 RepID=UPI0033220F1B